MTIPADFTGRPCTLFMGRRLNRLGIHSRIARNTALMDNAATMPAVVLSELLGLSITGAVR